jgi:hypothetical protein
MTDTNKQASRGPIPGPVVGQYFGFFNGVPKQHYDQIVAAAPFDKCNLLILAFVHTVQKDGVYVAQFTNWRDNSSDPSTPGDTDQDRVKLVVQTARKKNTSLKILISLGWGNTSNDAGNAAKTRYRLRTAWRRLCRPTVSTGSTLTTSAPMSSPRTCWR